MNCRKSLIKCIAAIVLFVILLAVTGGSFYLIDFALINEEGKNMSASEERLAERYPEVKLWCDSMRSVHAIRDTFIIDNDGNRLHALYAAADSTRNTALIIHGYGCNSLQYMYLGYMFHKSLGYNIFMPDLYAHGLSDGGDIQMGLKDADDVMLWTDVANNAFGGNTDMVVHGTSMGAATAMILSGKEKKPFIKCYIEDSGYTSAWDEFKFQLDDMFSLPSFPLLHASSMLTKLRFGWSFDEANPLDYVSRCDKPMLFIHSDNDTFVPSWMVHPLYKAKKGEKELWIPSKSAHAKAYSDYPDEYTQRVKSFLTEYGFR